MEMIIYIYREREKERRGGHYFTIKLLFVQRKLRLLTYDFREFDMKLVHCAASGAPLPGFSSLSTHQRQ